MQIFKNRRLKLLILNQNVYVEQILRNHEMWNCRFLIIFMNVFCRLIKISDEYIVDKNLRTNYQSIVKSLMYVMLKIKFDIIYSISVINRYVSNFTQIHWKTIKRIFRYLRDTYQMKLIFRERFRRLKDYTNSNWTDDQNIKRFIFEYVFNLSSEVINWFSKRQSIVTLLRNRIHRANRRRKENYLTTKSHDSVDMRWRVFLSDNDIRRQSRNHCFDQKFSISRTN
jgi:hypothetical protein